MSLFNRTYTFTDGTTAYGSQVEAEIANIVLVLNNLNTATANWGLVSVLNATSVPLVADCSSGSQHIADFKNNSVIKASVSSAGVITGTGGALSGTLTMSNSGTIAMGASKITGLANGTASTDAAAFGQLKILQTVTATIATAASSTSATFADTGLTATITPTSASNRILVMVSQQMDGAVTGAQTISTGGLRLLSAGSAVWTNTNASGQSESAAAGNTIYNVVPIVYVDSPATTSATIYKTQFNRLSGADGTVHVQTGSANTSTIVLMEIV